MSDQSGPTVFVVDDDEPTLREVRELVSSVGLPIESYTSALDLLDALDETRSGCIILDVRLPVISGLEAQERLIEKGVELPVIFVTAYGDVWTAVQAMKRGANDFLQKPFSSQELLDKIHNSIQWDRERREARLKAAEVTSRIHLLTPREMDVLIRIGAGKSNKSTARELNVSVRTIEFHRANLMRKLDLTSRESLAEIALTFLLTNGAPTGTRARARATRLEVPGMAWSPIAVGGEDD